MNLFARLSQGWRLGMTSLEVIRDNPKLTLFPILSGVALFSVMITFGLSIAASLGIGSAVFDYGSIEVSSGISDTLAYLLLFVFYLINFFVVVFFNVAMVYSVKEIFAGRAVRIMDGMRFAANRLRTILAWSAIAATVGTVLKMIQDNTGFIGQILIGIVGFAWGVMTYFVVPVLTYEEVGPVDAIKRSTEIIREKWGESIGAGFSFALLWIAGIIGSFIGMGILIALDIPVAGVLFLFGGLLFTIIITSTAKTVFLAAAYEYTQNNRSSSNVYFQNASLDRIFYPK